MLRKIFSGLLIATFLLGGVFASVSAFGGTGRICDIEPTPYDALGITAAELRTELQSGKTIEELFAAKGLDYDAFIADHKAKVETCLTDAVTAGTITQAQADLMLQNLDNDLHYGLMMGGPGNFGRGMGSSVMNRSKSFFGSSGTGVVSQILDKLSITLDEFKARLTGGETIQDIAAEAGVDITAVHTERIQIQLQNVEQALADGKITAEQAEQMRARINANLENPMPMQQFGKQGQNPAGQPMFGGKGMQGGRMGGTSPMFGGQGMQGGRMGGGNFSGNCPVYGTNGN